MDRSLKDIIEVPYSNVTYYDFYSAVVNKIGLDVCITYLPKGGVERFAVALRNDKHLNNIPMVEWDAAYAKPLPTGKIAADKAAEMQKQFNAKCAVVAKEMGVEFEAYCFVKKGQTPHNFKRELVRIGANCISPSECCSTLKVAARMWVEREGYLNEAQEESK